MAAPTEVDLNYVPASSDTERLSERVVIIPKADETDEEG